MHVFATFEQTLTLELALTSLEQSGIARQQILAVPLTKPRESRKLFDTTRRADGVSLFDTAAVLGTVFMLLGTVYGYVLAWGPIIWGIIGAVVGLLLGFVIKYAMVKMQIKGKNSRRSRISSEVVIIVRCEESQRQTVENILLDHHPLGISALKQPQSM
ncbi:hypothetical protein E5161_12525 [Cohnella pontilimi]|uniref:Uncharacterized protein n=1 Tax=Cohnella pontilimi TaxID=2564100 RepID=A0A4U0FBC4_9BACL|nr:hypothetical protein [Cohnella pontilimi]TJY42010.1 hypothetical protein E5161_12525 [Cohnella pontilimi]